MKLDAILLPYLKTLCNSDYPRKIVLKARQIGFSFCAAYCCIKAAAIYNKSLSMIISINQRSASELLNKVKQWAEALRIISNNSMTYTSNATEVVLSNGSRIISIPGGNADSARGYTVDGILVLDEFCYIPRVEELWLSVLPTLSNRFRGRQPEILIGSTPAGKNSLFARIWYGNDDFKHFQTNIEEAISDGLPVNLDEIHKLVPDPQQFATEYMCQFNDTLNALIDPNLLEWNIDKKYEFTDYFCGADWGRHHDASAIATFGRTKDGKIVLVDLQSMHNMEYDKQLAVARNIFQQYNPKCFLGDAGGLGGPLMEDLNKHTSANIKPFTFTAQNKPKLYEFFRKCVFDRNLILDSRFKQQILDDILLVQQVISEDGKTTYVAMRSSSSHADTISAIVLALLAIHDNPISSSLPVSHGTNNIFSYRYYF